MNDLTSILGSILRHRRLEDGGFSEHPEGVFRPDATAWGILALAANGADENSLTPSRWRLASAQGKEGCIGITSDHPEASWPTALAVLAWQGAQVQSEQQRRAIRFLLENFGAHGPRQPDSPLGHDPSIPGWPWVNGTHPWVEPTALGLLALSVSGHGDSRRAHQATSLLLDRQLSSGGWNYGNTTVYGQELRPMPAPTGLCLQALAGKVEAVDLEQSLDWLESVIEGTRTPLSLSWGLLGLSAWGKRPRRATEFLTVCLERQAALGAYPTSHLSLLLLAARAENGLLGVIPTWKGTAS